MSQSTSIAPERDQKLLEEFSLSAEPTVRKLLNTIEGDEHELYVYLQADHTHFVTEILSIDWKAGLMWLGTPYEKSLSAHCNASTAYVMVSFPDGVKVQFAGIGILQSQYQGADALRIAIPKSIVRLQRRNYFRVVADEELNSQVKLEIPALQAQASLIDISLAGIGFTIQTVASQHERGEILKDVRLTLADGTLAGADLTLAQAIGNLVRHVGLPPERALAMASSIPAQVIGRPDLGHLRPGAPADFVHLTNDFSLAATWRGGVKLG